MQSDGKMDSGVVVKGCHGEVGGRAKLCSILDLLNMQSNYELLLLKH